MLTAQSVGTMRAPAALGPVEGSDHLFLLPQRALGMDSTHLRQDLASLDFNLHLNLLHTAPKGNIWLSGTVPDENSQRGSSAHNRHSLTKEQTMHWFARIGSEDSIQLSDLRCRSNQFDADSLDGDHPLEHEGRDSTGGGSGNGFAKDLDRAKLVRDRQNEERQRKLEELRQQALAAQRFREQREEERRRRIEELRNRDYDRRSQVEERKRLIWEAERERREAILRKNQEREARIEAKRKNERSHIVFAFGSSTPRMLEPADTGGASFWGTRRATSTTNVMTFSAAQPLTRRSSERELDGSKKRATSAGGLDRKPGEGRSPVNKFFNRYSLVMNALFIMTVLS
ncbi:PREDICTED: uncharacterized protein LOC105365572 [Ceratosolen solmsi marchali]|uniref:Uncharacterized protein LOC105365572 n=1 Tax=Ceratosolen solmsi marchali TaxID=326594 RepID=A0AAJ7DZG2_9HYME|nr:PREDICTED: uncharacterized protein LOC105365572 [Ceratosolen solmsi marchali]